MIVCHQYKFIFLKTMKTAGTSIEIALSRFCTEADVITPINEEDEEIRRALGYRGPQNYLAPWENYGPQDWERWHAKGERKRRFYNHIPAWEAQRHLGKAVWDQYYKFCFERNPWDRVVSLYYWRCQSEPRPTIADYLDMGELPMLKHSGHRIYTIEGLVAVDRICRYEKLEAELETIRGKLGLPDRLELPKAKAHTRIDKRSYREIIGEAEKARIEKLFHDEISLLGYQF